MEPDKKAQGSVKEHFAVPVEDLYAAWIEEAQLKEWWKPMGATLQDMTNDVRPEGEVRYAFKAEGNGEAFEITGKYSVAEPEAKLVYSWNWHLPDKTINDGDHTLTVIFRKEGEGSSIEVTQESAAQKEDAVQPHRQGWEEGLVGLKAYLEFDPEDADA